ncbi:DUF4873 domain-containing protein [Pseudonocardia sp. DSM 110487]|uniref:DUF4873 domain-containing protein n=1 Tax=Pseudonocardia sp. DSM 110487 TaxID=2865833 RepID=UPI001C6960CB|nr:DUF4873 domain-containing protein [Pseudonocardia sp. DSM 110487]QYN36798.1 DUF4873 domain-containing protein [Pseudonocardia sp. DSM 110487]
MPEHDAPDHDDHDEGYTGPAVLTVDGRELAVQVRLDARHEPHDGRLHWFGRVRVEDGQREISSGTVELRTETGRAEARIGDVDPWGRYRLTGVGTPPFRIDEPDLTD